MAGDLLTLVMTSSCTVRRARGTAAREGWVHKGYGFGTLCSTTELQHHYQLSAWWASYLAPQPVWWNHGQLLSGTARQATKFTREEPKWMPTTQLHHSPLLRVVGKTELQHEGEGSIKGHQIFICHTALSPWLYPHSIVQQTTQKTAPDNNTMKSLQCRAKKRL